MARRAWLALAAAAAFILLAALPAYIAFISLHPHRCPYHSTPASRGLPYVNFTVETVDGIRIRGWIIEPNNTGPVFVVMHGYTMCKSAPEILNVSAALARRGYVVVDFDFRGHGDSGGTMTTIGRLEVRDARAVLRYVERLYPRRPIVLLGYSMGAVVAIVAGAHDPHVKAIVADSPYYRLGDVVPRWIGAKTPFPSWYGVLVRLWGELLAHGKVDPGFGPAAAGRVDKPLLVIYCTRDPLLRRSEAEKIAELSPCGRLVTVPGAGHVGAAEKLGLDRYLDIVTSVLRMKCG